MTASVLPVYHYEGNLAVEAGREYRQDYLQFPFDVPAGVGAVRMRLQYAPLKVDGISNLITLGVFDPNGFRGNAHRKASYAEFMLTPQAAAPGFLPGPIQPGRWLAQLAVQTVVPSPEPCAYQLDIELLASQNGHTPAPQRRPEWKAVRDQPGWFRGELHSHTQHSDGKLPPEELIATARQKGLDFLAMTDHNTISAWSALESTDLGGMLLIPGIELTTFYGHALALGIDHWIDWRTGYNGWTMEDAARATRAAGGLFILAHPNDLGSPVCTGCHWEYEDFDLDLADGMEVWNSAWINLSEGNQKNLKTWQGLQESGRRLTATCGSDYHSPQDWGPNLPLAYVYASSLSVPAILDGIRQGRVIISGGPWINLQLSNGAEGEPATEAHASVATAAVGDTLAANGSSVQLAAAWENAPAGAHLHLRSSAGLRLDLPVDGSGEIQRQVELQANDRVWAELYAADGDLLALTNPVFSQLI